MTDERIERAAGSAQDVLLRLSLNGRSLSQLSQHCQDKSHDKATVGPMNGRPARRTHADIPAIRGAPVQQPIDTMPHRATDHQPRRPGERQLTCPLVHGAYNPGNHAASQETGDHDEPKAALRQQLEHDGKVWPGRESPGRWQSDSSRYPAC